MPVSSKQSVTTENDTGRTPVLLTLTATHTEIMPLERKLVLACEGRFILYTSPFILYEVHRVLREYFYWGKDEADFVIGHISRHSQVINPTLSLNVIKDQTDNRILEWSLLQNYREPLLIVYKTEK